MGCYTFATDEGIIIDNDNAFSVINLKTGKHGYGESSDGVFFTCHYDDDPSSTENKFMRKHVAIDYVLKNLGLRNYNKFAKSTAYEKQKAQLCTIAYRGRSVSEEDYSRLCKKHWDAFLKRSLIPLSSEVERLMFAGEHYYKELCDSETQDSIPHAYDSLLDFLMNDKRPYGNKCIPASISYNLGWGQEENDCMPDSVDAKALEIHMALISKLKSEEADCECSEGTIKKTDIKVSTDNNISYLLHQCETCNRYYIKRFSRFLEVEYNPGDQSWRVLSKIVVVGQAESR